MPATGRSGVTSPSVHRFVTQRIFFITRDPLFATAALRRLLPLPWSSSPGSWRTETQMNQPWISAGKALPAPRDSNAQDGQACQQARKGGQVGNST